VHTLCDVHYDQVIHMQILW